MHRQKGPAAGKLPTDDVLLEQCGLAWLDASEGSTPLSNTIKASLHQIRQNSTGPSKRPWIEASTAKYQRVC
jgi:hypothetical protein